MSAVSNLAPALPVDGRGTSWPAALATLGLGLLCLGLLFREEIAAAVQVWTESTAYNHCFLVLPIAGFLAWERRGRLAEAAPRPMPWAAVAALPLGLAWLVAERIGIMEGRQLVALAFAEILALAVLGWPVWRRFAAPLLYLYFLVPFGAFVTPWLQDYTVWFIGFGLNLLGIPNYIDGTTIQIPEGSFYVAEACAGLRFLVASVAFGALYALMIYRSLWRRIAFILVSIAVPIVANGIRALGIVVLGHLLGSAQAAATDHVLYGWMFFSIVILLLLLLGLPFREDRAPPAPFVPARAPALPPRMRGFAAAAMALVAIAALGPAGAAALDRLAAAHPGQAPPAIALSGGCSPAPDAARETAPEGIRLAAAHLICEGQPVTVRIETFPPRASASTILGARRQIVGVDVDTEGLHLPGVTDGTWQLAEAEEPIRAVASALWIDGAPSGGGLTMRLAQARASLLGPGRPALLITVATAPVPASGGPQARLRARRAVAAFLFDHPALSAQLASETQRP